MKTLMYRFHRSDFENLTINKLHIDGATCICFNLHVTYKFHCNLRVNYRSKICNLQM